MPEEGQGSSVFRRRAAAEWAPVLVDQILSLSGPSESKQARKGPDGGCEHARKSKVERGLHHGDFLDFGVASRERYPANGARRSPMVDLGARETHAYPRFYNAKKPLKCQVENGGPRY